MPIPVAAWSRAYVCGRLYVGIAGSSLTGGMDVCAVCSRGISDIRREDMEVDKKDMRKEIKGIPVGEDIFFFYKMFTLSPI